MASMNRATIVGNLGRDPELKYTTSGEAVCNFSVATTAKWKGKDGKEKENTQWHRIVVWGRTAEACGKYLAKGRQVLVEGRIETREWEKDGQKKYVTEIIANDVQFLGSPDGNRSAPCEVPSTNQRSDQPFDDIDGDIQF